MYGNLHYIRIYKAFYVADRGNVVMTWAATLLQSNGRHKGKILYLIILYYPTFFLALTLTGWDNFFRLGHSFYMQPN